MSEFCVGDRVECLVDYPDDNDNIVIGSLGIVCEEYDEATRTIGVCWDDELEHGHDCEGNCDYGHGWRVYINQIALHQELNDDPFEFDEQSFKELLFGG